MRIDGKSQVVNLTADAPLGGVRPRIGHLDGMRGFSAMWVVSCHYLGAMFNETGIQHAIGCVAAVGWLGVDVFFVLSGFLITGILVDHEKRPGYFSRFYVRRMFRLAPLYYCYLALLFGVELAAHSVDRNNLLANVFYLQNFYLAAIGFWPKGTGLLWSLGVEEQFYLVWPTLVYRIKPRTLATIALLAGMCSLILRAVLTLSGHQFAAYVLIFSHMDGLCLGALIALSCRNTDPFHIQRFLRVAWFPVVITAMLLFGFSVKMNAEQGPAFTIAAPVLVAMLAGRTILRPGWATPFLQSNTLRWLGRYSYAIYVLQGLPGLIIQHWLFAHTHSVVLRLGGVTIIVALLLAEARLSWALLEGPMMRLREKLYPDQREKPAAQASA